MYSLESVLLETSGNPSDGNLLMNVLMEYYQGKPKELYKCEQYCENIIRKIGDGSKEFDILSKTPVSSNDSAALEKELAKFFKVNKVRIYWQNAPTVNAFTLPNSCITRHLANKNLMDGKGTNMNINVFIYTNTISGAGLTGKELLAIILHEIGHNFYACPVTTFMDILSWITSYGLKPIIQLIAKGVYLIGGELTDLARKNVPIVTNIIDAYSKVGLEINLLIRPAMVILNLPFVAIRNINVAKYGEEKAADSMAARYGYGPEAVTALKKMGVPNNTVYGKLARKTPAGAVVADMTELACNIISGITLDPHPSTEQRTQDILRRLRNDLTDGNYPKEVKKELEAEIARMEKVAEDISVINKSPDAPKIRKSIYETIHTATGGYSDFREIFNFYFDTFRF